MLLDVLWGLVAYLGVYALAEIIHTLWGLTHKEDRSVQ